MRYRAFCCIILFFLSASSSILLPSAIADSFHKGRFGDCLLSYMKTKWLAYKNNMTLYYFPFKYSDSLMLSRLEEKYTNNVKSKFKRIFKLHKKNISYIYKNSSYLYITDYYVNKNIEIDFNDQEFMKELRKNIAPTIDIPKHKLPSDRVSVALHVRKGGGYDQPLFSEGNERKVDVRRDKYTYADVNFPLKFPPDSYYIDQIKVLYKKLDSRPLYIYIFTDDKNPVRIANKYKEALQDLDIIFACREQNNMHDANVIEDFFAMQQYDCLIRSASNFSYCADLIGDFMTSIYPEHAYWYNGSLVVDKVCVKVRFDLS